MICKACEGTFTRGKVYCSSCKAAGEFIEFERMSQKHAISTTFHYLHDNGLIDESTFCKHLQEVAKIIDRDKNIELKNKGLLVFKSVWVK